MIMKTHPITHSIECPVILLKKRNNEVIGCINYSELKMKLSGSGPDEISFNVYHETDGIVCDFWNEIIDLKIVDVVGYGRFEISLQKSTDTSILKIVTGRSLEVELAQIPVYGLHINDDDYFTYGVEDESNLDAYGNIKPIKVYNPSDPDHSLLHLLLADKACHWQIGVVPEYITVTNGGAQEKELFTSFQRTFTIDGKDIYSFLTEELAPEANLIYVFDTYNRRINIYDQYEIGNDTNVFINNRNLANTITIDDNADSLKNCFRIVGGDDVITNYLSAVNMTGNYIWGFSDIQLKDMPSGLADAIKAYLAYKDSLTGKYNDTFTKLCSAYDRKSYLESSMMPSVELRNTTAREQIANMEREFRNTQIGISNLSIFNQSSFTGITNNIIAYGKALIDNRYTVECIDDITGNYPRYNGVTWTGKIHVYRTTDKTDTDTEIVSVGVNDDALNFVKQKILKALAKDGMYDVDLDVLTYTTSADYNKLVNYFQKYSLNRLKSFYDGYEACLAILTGPQVLNNNSSIFDSLYSTYKLRRDAVYDVYQIREKEVEKQNKVIEQIESEMQYIQESADFKSYLDKIDKSYWKLFNSYRREDVYQNDNYVSDGLTDGEILAKCKELLDYAQYQLSMACQLQRTCTVDLNNLLVMDEFKPFWDKFAIYNYIRVETDNEILKLRLMDIDIDFDNIDKLNVTFAENISGNGNVANDIPSIIKQASSIASSYNSTKLQSSQGKKAFNQVGNWIAEGLNAAQTTIANSDNNQVTLNNYGILLKSMTEEGNYGDFQTKLIGEGIYFTQDNWKTVSCALGTIYIDGKLTSGVIGQNIIGKLIAGETLYLTNDKGTVLIDGDTAKFTDITIDYVDKNGNRVKIGGASDRIFSISSNGSEVLYFNNVSNKMVMTGTLVGCDGDFSGTLTACNMSASNISGTNINGSTITGNKIDGNDITGNTITSNTIFGNTVSGNTITGNDIKGNTITGNTINGNTVSGNTITGNDVIGNKIVGGTIKIGDDFYVDENGKVYAIDGSFSGTINAGTSIISPVIEGGSIYGCYINVGDGNFVVGTDGKLIANSGTFKGDIIGGTITGSTINGVNGTIGGFTIGETALYNGKSSLSAPGNGVYLGTDGISCGDGFKVSKNGILNSNYGIFKNAAFENGIYVKIDGSSTLYPVVTLTEPGVLTFANTATHTNFFGSVQFIYRINPTENGTSMLLDHSGSLHVYNDAEFSGKIESFGEVQFHDVLNRETTSAPNVRIGDAGRLNYVKNASLKKWKHAISSITDKNIDPHLLYNAKPCQFIYNFDYLHPNDCRYGKTLPGFLVDELMYVYPIAIDYDENGNPMNWNERYLIPPMLYLIQEQHEQNLDLQSQIIYLKNSSLSLQGQLLLLQGENAILKQRLDRLEGMLSA